MLPQGFFCNVGVVTLTKAGRCVLMKKVGLSSDDKNRHFQSFSFLSLLIWLPLSQVVGGHAVNEVPCRHQGTARMKTSRGWTNELFSDEGSLYFCLMKSHRGFDLDF